MRIATKERYALQMTTDLASQKGDEPVSLLAIAARQGISIDSLRSVARALVEAKLVETGKSRLYHYRLAQPSDSILLQDIFRSTDGRFACTNCAEANPEACKRYRVCSKVHFWEGLQEIDLPVHEKKLTLKTVTGYFATRPETLP